MSNYQFNDYPEWITQIGSSVGPDSSSVDKADVIRTYYKVPTSLTSSYGKEVDNVIDPQLGTCIEYFQDVTYHFPRADLVGYPISFQPNKNQHVLDTDDSLAIAKVVQEIRDLDLGIVEGLEQYCNNSIASIVMGNALRSWSRVLSDNTDSIVLINRESNSKLPTGEYVFEYHDVILTVRQLYYELTDKHGNKHLYGLFREDDTWSLVKQNVEPVYKPKTQHVSALKADGRHAKVILSVVTSNRRQPKGKVGECENVNTDKCAELVQ